MSEEQEEVVSMSDDEIKYMLMAVALNTCQSTYDKTHLQVKEFFFKLSAQDMLSTWTWLNDANKVKVVTANKAIFDTAVKELIKNGCK